MEKQTVKLEVSALALVNDGRFYTLYFRFSDDIPTARITFSKRQEAVSFLKSIKGNRERLVFLDKDLPANIERESYV